MTCVHLPIFPQVGFSSLRLWPWDRIPSILCRHTRFLSKSVKYIFQNDLIVSLKNKNVNKHSMKMPVVAPGPASDILAYPGLALYGSF